MKCYDCPTCTRPDCIHRDAYRRLPRNVGGLDLCPGYVSAEPEPTVDTSELESKIAEMMELDKLAQEAKEAADTIRDELKATMQEQNTSEMSVGRFVIRWTETLSTRLDTKAIKTAIPEVYAHFTKQVYSRRFTISG